MVHGPSLPERPTIVPGGAKGFVSGDCRRAVLFPRPTVFADRDDRRGLTIDDGGVDAPRVIGAICGHGSDLFALGELVEQFRQDRTVTIAVRGELDRADVGCGGVHGQMHLAPLTTALNTVLSRLPLSIAEKLDAGAVHQQDQGAIGAPIRNLNG